MAKAKINTSKSPYHKAFADAFTYLTARYGRYQVWSDFITMTACSISNSCDKRFFAEREALYMASVGRYEKSDAEKFVEMFSIVVQALSDNPEQDFLGDIFSSLNLHNEWRGQFFTPYHVGELMAKINSENLAEELAGKECITVSDCCCGAGCLLVAYANEARKAGVDFQHRIIFVAQDVDYTAALMCYIQLSLLGCKAVVKIGDSIVSPFAAEDLEADCTWLTPMYIYGDAFRLAHLMSEALAQNHNNN